MGKVNGKTRGNTIKNRKIVDASSGEGIKINIVFV